jgi:hypothetical protein
VKDEDHQEEKSWQEIKKEILCEDRRLETFHPLTHIKWK